MSNNPLIWPRPARIWAIPTLVKTFPPPSQRAIGTFEDTSQLLQWLDSCFLASLESYL